MEPCMGRLIVSKLIDQKMIVPIEAATREQTTSKKSIFQMLNVRAAFGHPCMCLIFPTLAGTLLLLEEF